MVHLNKPSEHTIGRVDVIMLCIVGGLLIYFGAWAVFCGKSRQEYINEHNQLAQCIITTQAKYPQFSNADDIVYLCRKINGN